MDIFDKCELCISQFQLCPCPPRANTQELDILTLTGCYVSTLGQNYRSYCPTPGLKNRVNIPTPGHKMIIFAIFIFLLTIIYYFKSKFTSVLYSNFKELLHVNIACTCITYKNNIGLDSSEGDHSKNRLTLSFSVVSAGFLR